jgi:hypothetical protein
MKRHHGMRGITDQQYAFAVRPVPAAHGAENAGRVVEKRAGQRRYQRHHVSKLLAKECLDRRFRLQPVKPGFAVASAVGYRVELNGPGGGPPRTCRTVVSGSEIARCRVELARVSADDFFRETGWWR